MSVNLKHPKRKFKLKSVDTETYIARYAAVWECETCGREGSHTFHDKRPSESSMDYCWNCDKDFLKQFTKKKS